MKVQSLSNNQIIFDSQELQSYWNSFIEQEFLPEKLSGTVIFEPGKNSREEDMRKRMKQLWGEKYGY